MSDLRWGRRDFLCLSAQVSGVLGLGSAAGAVGMEQPKMAAAHEPMPSRNLHSFNGSYQGSALGQIAFPMGGMGAGMICLEGTGALSKFSLRHRPHLNSEPKVFAAISIRGSRAAARVLEGPVPTWKLRPQFPSESSSTAAWGLPRFRRVRFDARFPFATVHLEDEEMPLEVELKGWSPFAPGDADSASLPVAGLEYRLTNRSPEALDAVFSFNAENFMVVPTADPLRPRKPLDRIKSTAGGFVLYEAGTEDRPWNEGCWAAWVDDPNVKVNHAWLFSGVRLWNDIASGACATRDPQADSPSPGASIFVPFKIAAGESRTIVLRLAWYVPNSNLIEPHFNSKEGKRELDPASAPTYQPWYAGRFASIDDVKTYWQDHYQQLRQRAKEFTRTFYDCTLPPEAMEAVAANLTILKSPTVLRQRDGRLWGWEGCGDEDGSCYGSSNHVWNYAQSIAHLFPELERGLRETELGPNLGKDGYQVIRTALPIRPVGDAREDGYGSSAAADGQLGGIIKVYRDWRISGDTSWLRRLWPQVKLSLDYCIKTWDPLHRGCIEEAHLNTYDVEFWGADSLCTSLYLGALRTATLMGKALGENVEAYYKLHSKCTQRIDRELFNGEYFFQRTELTHLRTPFEPNTPEELADIERESPEVAEAMRKEGPPNQYGQGCLADGVLGAWLCFVSGAGEIIDRRKVENHLTAVYRYNFKSSLMDHANELRSFFACGAEAGLLICSWPNGGRPSLPFRYVDEVWTGIEYQVASHLIALGKIDEGLEIVGSCRRRYDGRVRNPFAEVEAGHWYARAMSSYALLQAFSGARFDAVDKILYLNPPSKGDFRCFLSTATGFGTVGVRNGHPFVEVVSGEIPYKEIKYAVALHTTASRA